MATLLDYVYIPVGSPFTNICSITNFFLNLTYYLVFSSLMVFVVYRLGMAIYNISHAEGSEAMEKLRDEVTDIIISIIGLLVISSAIFFPKMILETMGVPDDKNPFIDMGGCGVVGEDVVGPAGGIVIDPIGLIDDEEEGGGGELPEDERAALLQEQILANRQRCIDRNLEPIDPGEGEWNPYSGEWNCCRFSCPSRVLPPVPPVAPPEDPPVEPEPPVVDIDMGLSTRFACSNSPKSASNQLNIGSFNIGGENSSDGTNAASLIRGGNYDFDIIGFQEVLNYDRNNLDVRGDLVSALASQYPNNNMYTASVYHDGTLIIGNGPTGDGGPYGNVIVSRFPIIASETVVRKIDPVSESAPDRYMISTVVDVPNVGRVRVFNIHTRYGEECHGTAMAYNFIRETLKPGEKMVVVGDFNLSNANLFGGECSYKIAKEKGDEDGDGIKNEAEIIYSTASGFSGRPSTRFEPSSLVSCGSCRTGNVDKVLVNPGLSSSIVELCDLGDSKDLSDQHNLVGATVQL